MNIENAIMLSGVILLLSACGTTNTTRDYPDGRLETRHEDLKEERNSESYGGILGSWNLDFDLHYKLIKGKKSGGAIIDENKVTLPDVEGVMHPKFTSDDTIAAFLSEKGANLSSSKRAESPAGS